MARMDFAGIAPGPDLYQVNAFVSPGVRQRIKCLELYT
jgi:hypothetical protein